MTSNDIIFSPMTVEMLPACADMAQAAPDPWTLAGLEKNQQNLNCWNFVALKDGEPVAFACFLTVAGSADLQQIVVHPAHRRCGIAKALLLHALAELAAFDVGRCLLEVRAGNQSAIALYQSLGFKALAKRPGMFQAPPEDGLLMAKMLADTSAP